MASDLHGLESAGALLHPLLALSRIRELVMHRLRKQVFLPQTPQAKHVVHDLSPECQRLARSTMQGGKFVRYAKHNHKPRASDDVCMIISCSYLVYPFPAGYTSPQYTTSRSTDGVAVCAKLLSPEGRSCTAAHESASSAPRSPPQR